MNVNNFNVCKKLVDASYIQPAVQERYTRERKIHHLFDQRKLPSDGWDESYIELVLSDLAQWDSNNYTANCGVGEREGRVASGLVERRHYRLIHGIGRSGDITAVQPKAAGSSVIMKLTNSLILDAIRRAGVPSCQSAFVVPMATGMALVLCMLTFRSYKPSAKYVLWSRIDQKSCFKSISTAGYEPVVIECVKRGDELHTDTQAIQDKINELGADNIACVMSTTSCFAPRVPDDVEAISAMCAEHNIHHLVNNAYGVQSSKCMHVIQQGNRVGRVDAFVQSGDKNFMVPVGGAIIAGFDAQLLAKIGQTYPGRASASPTIDLMITLLSLGWNGYASLLSDRKQNYVYLRDELKRCAEKHGERLLETPHNPISMAITLTPVNATTTDTQHPEQDSGGSAAAGSSVPLTQFGSMLFTRSVSGTRVVAPGTTKEINGHTFTNYGSHHDHYPVAYLTAAAAIGMKKYEVDMFIKRLDETFVKWKKKCATQQSTSHAESEDDACAEAANASLFTPE